MDERPKETWVAQLQGHAFDLETWRDVLSADSISVAEVEQSSTGAIYYLKLPNLSKELDIKQVRQLAEQEVECLNGLVRLQHDTDPVRVHSLIYVDVNGQNHYYIELESASTRLRARIGRPRINDVLIQVEESIVQKWRRTLEQDDDLSDAVIFFSRAMTSESPWFDLYKTYEMLVKFAGGQRQHFSQRDWVNRERNDLFYHSANYYRHSRAKAKRPANLMVADEGREFVETLLRKALDVKRASRSPSDP